MSSSHNLEAPDISVDDILRSFDRVNLSESGVNDEGIAINGEKEEGEASSRIVPGPHASSSSSCSTSSIAAYEGDPSQAVKLVVGYENKEGHVGDPREREPTRNHGDSEATEFLKDLEHIPQAALNATLRKKDLAPEQDRTSNVDMQHERSAGNVKTKWPIPEPQTQQKHHQVSSKKKERHCRFNPIDKRGRSETRKPSRGVRGRAATPHPKVRNPRPSVPIEKEGSASSMTSFSLRLSPKATQDDHDISPQRFAGGEQTSTPDLQVLKNHDKEEGQVKSLDSFPESSTSESGSISKCDTGNEYASQVDERRKEPKEECDIPRPVPTSSPLSDYESPELFPSHDKLRSKLFQDWNSNPVPEIQVPQLYDPRAFLPAASENMEDATIGSSVGMKDVEMQDGTKKVGNRQHSERITKRMMGEDKRWSTYPEFVPIADEDVRMDTQSPVHPIASFRALAQPQTALHPDASLHAGHGQETWRQLATNPPQAPPPATRPLPQLPPLPPPYTRISQQSYPPFSFLPHTNKMDDSPMDDGTQVTQSAPLQPFTQTFQRFQLPVTTNAFGWGQAAQSQLQPQPQPVATPFSFNPQPAPISLPQYIDPNEAAAYNFWFTMLAKIREQEHQYQQQQQPMTTLAPQFSQPPRPFTPMFELPSQSDGRPLVQRFSDDPPSPRFGGLRSRRSRRNEDRGFDPFHIGCGMRPLAPSSAIEGDIRVRGSEANLIHRLALEKRLEEEAKQRAAKERQLAEQAALLVKDHEKRRKVKKRLRNSSSRRGNSPRKFKIERCLTLEKLSPETPIVAPSLPSPPTQATVSRHEILSNSKRVKRQTFCPTFSMAIQRFLRAC